MPTLTPRQKQILDYIKGYINKNGFSPTFEEISHQTKKAFSTVHEHVEALIEKGFLIKKDNSTRGIELNEQTEMVKIPLVGTIAAGRPIEAIEEKETLTIPKNLLAKSGKHFALQVRGDSMINDGVFDGDKVIIRKQNEAENGDMVVALIDREEATLKRFFKEKNKIRLQPANPSFKPICAKNVTIQGRVISVIRSFGNNEENNDFTENTTSYINQADIKYRKKLGQYFTPKPVREALIKQLPKNTDNPKILDPACGTGEFLLTAKKYFPQANLYGWDIDKNLIGISQKNISEAKLKCIDSLANEQYGTFDYVIGNPPYFEFTPSAETKNKFQAIIGGRINIFSLFVYQGLKWLKEGGYLAYVISPSMNNGAYFAKLRNFIVENANIEYLHVLDNSKLFHKAQQTTMLLILKKGKNKGNYIFKKNGILIFSENAKYLKEAFNNKTTLCDLGYKVKTSRVIWNENKSLLTNDAKKGTPLIWAQNIIANALKLSANNKKPQYITKNGPDIGPAIVVNRITGTVNSAKLKAALIPPGMKFFAENHVNVITPAENTGQGQFNILKKSPKKSISLNEIIKQLTSPEKLEAVRSITGNTQISKTELEKLFPLDIKIEIDNFKNLDAKILEFVEKKNKFLDSIKSNNPDSINKYKRVVVSPLRYAGGKSLGVGFIMELLPDNIKRLISPFFGGGSIEIACDKYLDLPIIGYDIFDILVNYWQIQIKNPKALYEKLLKFKPDENTYKKIKVKLKAHWQKKIKLPPLDLAAYYYFNHNLSYGPGFLGWPSKIYLDNERYKTTIEKIRDFSVKNIKIECASFEKPFAEYPNDFFYCDPPYLLGEDTKMFRGIYPMRNIPIHHNGFEHEKLRDLLKKHKGGFVLSYNNCKTIRNWYRDYKQYFPKWQYTMGQGETRIGLNRKNGNNNHIKESHEIIIFCPPKSN